MSYYLESGGRLDFIALAAFVPEWTRTDLAISARIDQLTGATGDGLSGEYRLNATTVTDDALVDVLDGGNGADWFLASLTGPIPDSIVNRQSGDIVTEIP